MSSKRNIEKRIERLEAEREPRRIRFLAIDGRKLDDDLFNEIIKISHERFKRSPDETPREVDVGLPTLFEAIHNIRSAEDDAT